jgi:hypothetical protein
MKTSVIITSRNDGYGSNLEERAIACLTNVSTFFDEVIYVDWDSPNKESLSYKIRNELPRNNNIKTIIVSREFVAALNLPEGYQQCCEVLGRNIGIRRAANDWVLSTNIDVILNPFTTELLNNNLFYTCPRIDVPRELYTNPMYRSKDPHYFLHLLNSNANSFSKAPPGDHISKVVCCGDFQLAHTKVWNFVRGFEESMVFRSFSDSNLFAKNYPKIEVLNYNYYHLNHSDKNYVEGEVTRKRNVWSDYVVENFQTKNNDSWGFLNYKFEEFVL